MKLVLTGSSGFVGTHLLRCLADFHWTGVAVSRRSDLSTPPGWLVSRRLQRVGQLKTEGQVDGLIHLEVKQHVLAPTAKDVAEFQSVNVDGTQQWLDWCTANGVPRFVYFSSIKAVEPAASGITDEQAGGPQDSLYGKSKWEAEQRVRAWAAQDPARSALILRPSVVYGPGNVANVAAMVGAICRNRFFLVGPNANVKSMVSVTNVAAAVVHLLQRMQPGKCDVYNLVDRESFTVRQIDAMIRAQLGRKGNSPTLPIAVARAAAKFGDVFHGMTGRAFPINGSRLEALLENTHFSGQKLIDTGFQHPQTTEQGLAEMVTWYLASVRRG